MSKPLILASASKQRLELLSQLGVSCEVVPADIDETPHAQELAETLVERLAVSKAQVVAQNHPNRLVLAADTIVYLPGSAEGSSKGSRERIFGKPQGEQEVLDTLEALSGAEHQVATGLALYDGYKIHRQVVKTVVTFATIPEALRVLYCQSGEPVGKAGAYAIQGRGARFVKSIRGSYSNVVGLPLYETSVWLARAGLIH